VIATAPSRADDGVEAPPSHRQVRALPALLVLGAILFVPFAIALVVLHDPRWFPLGDIAQTELRVRDVWSAHPPLIGLPGRIGSYPNQGSHPGPLSFYALWPSYAVLGSSSFALQCASVVVQFGAMAVALWIAWRRGGIRVALAIGAVLAVLAHNLGVAILIEPWNPYLPVMTWVVLLCSVWSVCCDDFLFLPFAIVAGSFCMQTHISYVAPVCGLVALAFVWAAVTWWRRRGDGAAQRQVWLPAGIALVLGGLAWLPPIIEEATGHPGNLTVIWNYFRNPPEASVGLHRGLELLLSHLDPWGLLTGQHGVNGTLIPGTLLLIVWVASALVAIRVGPAALQRLHLVLAVTLVFELIALSRIFGEVFYYLMLWSFAVTALLLVAVGWTAGSLWSSGAPHSLGRLLTAGAALSAAVLLVFSGWFAWDAAYAQMPLSNYGTALGGVMPDAISALHADEAARAHAGTAGPYLITWNDPVAIGARGFAFLNELERAGFDVGAIKPYEVAVRSHRVLDPSQAAAQVHLAIGADIATWKAKPGARMVAYYDPRTPAQRAASDRLHADVVRTLREHHLDAELPEIDDNLYGAITDTRLPTATRRQLRRIANLDLPLAVFIAPPSD
jgi:hypothetical protein